ncbi:MAG: hypothetical protein H0X40_15170 [Chthoniobacterales bacterium]|nr:hypothetical protein [Chthoniobacterales bacterium]
MQTDPNYVSVLFVNLLQPIFDLFKLLEQSDPKGPNEVQAGMLENGYAVSIIVLSALVLDSALNRTRYVRSELKRESTVATLKRLGADHLAQDIEEIFALRDSIAHNHIWKVAMHWNHSSGMALDSAEKLPAYGDEKFNRVVDSKTRATHRLHLDAFPNRIHRATAIAVLKKTVEALKFLEGLDRRYVYLSQPWHVTRGNELVPFYKWVDGL